MVLYIMLGGGNKKVVTEIEDYFHNPFGHYLLTLKRSEMINLPDRMYSAFKNGFCSRIMVAVQMLVLYKNKKPVKSEDR